MMDIGAFFLSRVKNTARIEIIEVIQDVSKTCIGFDLHSGRLGGFRGEIVEIIGNFIISKTTETFQSRVAGFWNPRDSSYHWYVTNLKVSSTLIYPLYRLRWQLELIWKGWKSFLHLDEITSTNRNIIVNMTLVGMCAGLISGAVSISVMNDEPKIKQVAISVQRSISFLLRIGQYLYQDIRNGTRGVRIKLLDAINLFKGELIDPNFKNRINTLGRVYVGLILFE